MLFARTLTEGTCTIIHNNKMGLKLHYTSKYFIFPYGKNSLYCPKNQDP